MNDIKSDKSKDIKSIDEAKFNGLLEEVAILINSSKEKKGIKITHNI